MRAVRQPLYWAEDPLRRLGARPDYLAERTALHVRQSLPGGPTAVELRRIAPLRTQLAILNYLTAEEKRDFFSGCAIREYDGRSGST